MKLKDLAEWEDTPYKKTCGACEKEHTVYTQPDNYAEYNARVYVQCDCGDVVPFNLPVN